MRNFVFISITVLLTTFPLSRATAWSEPATFESDRSPLKALVFLSKECPCSTSHVEHLNELATAYPNTAFFGVITDSVDESSKSAVVEYYSPSRFRFPIIQDEKQTLMKTYGALKTPHVVLLQKNAGETYKVLYQGGLSDQRNFSKAKKIYLKENLQALAQHEPVKYAQGKSLGCYIRRL